VAAARAAELAKKGSTSPVRVEGTRIAKTFWGRAWCENLESYSDFSNRLPRGRTYVRSGAVVDLQIAPGKVEARVMGTSLYRVTVAIDPVRGPAWKELCAECGGKIASVVELLRGKVAPAVLEVVTRRERGLFPSPREIHMDCSCPDGAVMCKHVAAALYGVGARLDEEPGLFFVLRKVDPMDLVGALAPPAAKPRKTVAAEELSSIFGIELDELPARAKRTK
jgi:uncharacterized Zn finger protein